MVLPPPNVTGVLHLGHAWNSVLGDAISRYKILNKYEVLWVPGTDHAGIATQVKAEKILKTKYKKTNYSEKYLLDFINNYKNENIINIKNQWDELGLLLNYDHQVFTLDDNVQKTVNYVFKQLYDQKLIYQKLKMVSWDCELETAISNIEVEYKQVEGKLYYFKYFVENKIDFLIVATTRPETMFGDKALFVNPDDPINNKFINMMVINPVNDQLIPVLADKYVDQEFGTGVMKCTPAHDFNDYNLAIKHQLSISCQCIDQQGKMTILAKEFNHLDRFKCRVKLVDKLVKLGLVEKIEDYQHQVNYSQRTNSIIEPMLSKQWFVKTKEMAKKVLEQQKNIKTKVIFFPNQYNETLAKWLENIEDWCISRQLIWGIRLPVWINKFNNSKLIVEKPKDINNYKQVNDVLDTWFSSALLPLVAFDWLNKDKTYFNKFYPTQLLITGYDIIFFWIARMMMQDLHFLNDRPFDRVLIHGLIRDNNGKKMSKSLNNGILPKDIIKNYGIDSLRLFLIANTSLGNDIIYDQQKLKNSWNFINKLWNASRYVFDSCKDIISNLNTVLSADDFKNSLFHDQWIISKLNELEKNIVKNFKKYDFIHIYNEIYHFFWKSFCSSYIELTKTNKTIISQKILYYCLKRVLIILHPFIPYITDEIYQYFNLKSTILLEDWNNKLKISFDNKNLEVINFINLTIAIVRNFRINNNLNKTIELSLHTEGNQLIKNNYKFINSFLIKIINSNIILKNKILNKNNYNLLLVDNIDLYIKKSLTNNLENNKKLIVEQKYLINEIKRSEKILNNVNFIKKANKSKIEEEKTKYKNYLQRYKIIHELLTVR